MSSNEEKLENFQKNCYDMADLESKTIMDKINNEINDDINQELKEYEKEMAKKYEEKIKRLEQKYNTDIFNLNNDARYKVVEKENEAKNEIKREVVKKIMLFKQTDEYFAFLTRNINQAMENLKIENGDNVKLYLVKSDIEKYKEPLQSQFGYEFKLLDEENIGGSKCVNETKKIAIDNTLKTLINEKFQIEVED